MELVKAVLNVNFKEINRLLDEGSNIDFQDSHGRSALMIASWNSYLGIVKLLLDRGADPNLQSNDGSTALMYASSGRDIPLATIKLLLDRGPNPFLKDKDGRTALDVCRNNECKQLISKYMWNILYQSDKKLAQYYSRSNEIPKDVWELILLNKRQKELCQNMNTDEYKQVLIHFAETLKIPINDKITKAELCNLISKYLSYGQYNDPKRSEFIKQRM